MSSEFVEEGKVLEIGASKTAKGTFYRLHVEDLDTGDSEWYGLGKEKPDFGEDSIVSFEYSENDKGYLNIFEDSLEVIDEVKPKGRGGRGNSSRGGSRRGKSDDDEGSRGRGRSSSRGSSRSSRSSRDDDDEGSSRSSRGSRGSKSSGRSSGRSGGKGSSGKDDTTQKMIELQAARNAATPLLAVAIAEGAITLPTKKADKLAALEEAHDKLVARFLEQNDAVREDGWEAAFEE